MNALDFLLNIVNNENLLNYNFKYCLVNEKKIPYTLSGSIAKPNHIEDFVTIDNFLEKIDDIDKYAGIGISIQGSNISAIDVDHCFSKPFDLSTGDERAKDVLWLFKYNYVEFSFSGTGLRVFFITPKNLLSDYTQHYYIKNSNYNIEYYNPENSYRYVTITGKTLINNNIEEVDEKSFKIFLDKYMKRNNPISISKKVEVEKQDLEILKKKLRKQLLINGSFQEIWFSKAPGSNSNESELDYFLIKFIYDNITKNKENVKELFELSPYFNSKDSKHKYKWNYNNFRYFEYIWERI